MTLNRVRLGEHAVSSLEEIKAFTERIEDLALLRNSEKKHPKSARAISKYLQGLNSTFNRLDDLLNSYGYDPVKDNELFIEVQRTLKRRINMSLRELKNESCLLRT